MECPFYAYNKSSFSKLRSVKVIAVKIAPNKMMFSKVKTVLKCVMPFVYKLNMNNFTKLNIYEQHYHNLMTPLKVEF